MATGGKEYANQKYHSAIMDGLGQHPVVCVGASLELIKRSADNISGQSRGSSIVTRLLRADIRSN